MECPKCGVEVRINKYSGFKYQPFDKNLWSWNKGIEIPFYCKSCGAINFPYKPIRDVVFIYPYPRPEKVGSIYLPQDDEYYRSSVNDLFESKGVVLAVGKYMYSSGEKISQKILKVGDIVLFEISAKLIQSFAVTLDGALCIAPGLEVFFVFQWV